MLKTLGVIMMVIGVSLGLWVNARVTSFAGQFYSWTPPFTEYEIMTIAVGLIAVILVITGLSGILNQKQ